MGRQILEIIPKKDPKRESGVYWSTAQHQGRDQIHVAPFFMTVEEAELQLGLCRTREEAEGAGDAAATFKAEMLKAQTALTEKEIELAKKKQEYSDKQHNNDTEIQALKHQINGQNLLIQQQKQDNEVLSARLEAEQAEEHFKTAFQKQEAPEDIEKIKFENNILDTLLKTKKCASKAELKRLFEQGGIKVEGEKVTDYQSLNNFEGEMIIQMGKGSFFKIVK
jgi:hypothetical protein